MRSVLLFVGLVLPLVGCAHLDYIGETAAPTTTVQVFYSEANVPQAYRVMGEAVASAGLLVSTDKIQRQLVDKARKTGADAVVLTGIEHYESGQSTSSEESTTRSKDKKGSTKVSSSSSSQTSVEESKRIHALFIKYLPASETLEAAPALADSMP
jgi:predicted TIM-barrel enzyme